ncbi:DMSO reductase anchor subunit [Ectothiorhodosinus mongolicus]|uniref:DMSO reductase anchor subunit n=1 Tax=Ectothiorhodosinus mongolicus TaxID=233100 RepID=A0A1R3VSH3_9GAMM|nr:DmsC/YnfH family molybdoenzyme membrane anchor subunit [Ectothiorhodosinus mongolicus]ULX56640.1 DMSO reductase [Ectothiorhodosinus mongolicus]SIT66616.1 DMSO reductase anchor subunit [Ectothiorhodosinus mongolicus]
MHPALSVILFTVMSGAGYGLFMLVALLHVFGGYPDPGTSELVVQLGLALALITTGLVSSTQHLANPKNAWRAVMRVRTSWLSREAVLAIGFYPFALLYGLSILRGGALEPGGFTMAMGLISVALAGLTVFCTGMIYASLKTIRQWNTALTPANYLMLGLALGAVLLVAVHAVFQGRSEPLVAMALSLLVLAALLKWIYYVWIREPSGPTINTATGFTRGTVRMMDPGHTAGTFLTREFGYDPGAQVIGQVRLGVYGLGFVLPILLLSWILLGASVFWLVLAVPSALAGVGLERWLFFAEARHAVMLYHGRQHT